MYLQFAVTVLLLMKCGLICIDFRLITIFRKAFNMLKHVENFSQNQKGFGCIDAAVFTPRSAF